MKRGSQKSSLRFWLGTIGVAFMLGAGFPLSAEAQTNTFPSTGNVGIGTTSPSEQLTISGSSHVGLTIDPPAGSFDGSLIFKRGGINNWFIQSRNSGAPADAFTIYDAVNLAFRFTIDRSGKVGIGTTSPLYSLDVNGGINGFRTKAATTSSSDAIAVFENSSGIQAIVRGNGNVGIGTTAPAYKLDVQANAQWVARFKKTDSTHGGILVDAAAGYNPNLAMSVNGTIKWYMNSNTSGGDALQFWESSGLNPRFTLTQAGSVGIGTGGPGYRLDVQGGQINSAGGLCIAGDCKTAWSQVGGSQWANSGSNIQFTTGTVGIGAASPGSPVFITGNEPSTDYATLRVKPSVTHGGIVIDSANNTSQAHLRFFKSGVPKWQIRIPYQDGVEDFRLYSWTSATDVLNVTPSGNVGIGTGATPPSAKLHVAGDVSVTGTGNINASGTITGGTINAKYQDVAEWVESSQTLAAGTVVVLDHTRSNQVIASSQAYDTRVAGVISLQPGITLGETGAGKVLVATTGRVKIKVDATAGPIQIGDLLVTSDVPGVAMKSEPIKVGGRLMHMPGTLIGKALEPLEKGSEKILVLLSLQ